MRKKLIFTFVIGVLTGLMANAQKLKKIEPSSLPPVSKSYSQAILVESGKLLFVSGQVSVNAQGEIVGKGDLRAQTKQVFENLKTVLAASGATFEQVVKLTYFVVSSHKDGIGVVREVRTSYLPTTTPPASTFLYVEGLYDPNILIEIEAVAVLPQ